MIRNNPIRDQIKQAKSFREVITLREKVWSLSGKIDLDDFLDIRDRIESKVKDFENPMFGDARVEIVFGDGSRKDIDPRELSIIMGKGGKLSDYIFTTHPEAIDYELHIIGFEELGEKRSGENLPSKIELNESLNAKTGALRESILRIVKLAMKLANMLFSTYSKVFPSIADDLKLIKNRIEELFEKIASSYY